MSHSQILAVLKFENETALLQGGEAITQLYELLSLAGRSPPGLQLNWTFRRKKLPQPVYHKLLLACGNNFFCNTTYLECIAIADIIGDTAMQLRWAVTPQDYNRPISQWTNRELAQEMVQQKIVEEISPRHVGRLLAEAELQPNQTGYWLNPPRPKFWCQSHRYLSSLPECTEKSQLRRTHDQFGWDDRDSTIATPSARLTAICEQPRHNK